ncbi:MAG: DUF4097 family beta strand repeat protein [Cryomorphaceae bacterium]|nr:DUF4097 family beta strand repeat protein [Cryomorphaceae bacterium]
MNKITFLLSLSVFCFCAVNAKDYQKEFSKAYETNPNVTLETSTSFGALTIIPWENNEVEISVSVIVDAKSEKEAQEVFERIEVEMRGTRDQVAIETEIGNGSWRNQSGNFEINITIHAPEKMKSKINHSYGDLNFGAFEGKAVINVSYGSFIAESFTNPDNDVKISYSSGRIKDTSGGNYDVQFGSLSFDKINGDANIHAGYSSLDIKNVTPNCKELGISSEFGSADISLDPKCSFKVDANASFGSIELPQQMKITSSKSDFNSTIKEGTIGTGQGELSISCSFGDVDVDIN